jgi:hypothetical protein
MRYLLSQQQRHKSIILFMLLDAPVRVEAVEWQ